MNKHHSNLVFVASATAALTFAGPVLAEGLPKQLAWTAYGVGSAGYNQSVAVGAALKNKMGIALRVLPGKKRRCPY